MTYTIAAAAVATILQYVYITVVVAAVSVAILTYCTYVLTALTYAARSLLSDLQIQIYRRTIKSIITFVITMMISIIYRRIVITKIF